MVPDHPVKSSHLSCRLWIDRIIRCSVKVGDQIIRSKWKEIAVRLWIDRMIQCEEENEDRTIQSLWPENAVFLFWIEDWMVRCSQGGQHRTIRCCAEMWYKFPTASCLPCSINRWCARPFEHSCHPGKFFEAFESKSKLSASCDCVVS